MVIISFVQWVKDKTLTNRAAIKTQRDNVEGACFEGLRAASKGGISPCVGVASGEQTPRVSAVQPYAVLRFRSSLDSRRLTLEQVQRGLHAASRCSQHLYCSSCTPREAAAAAARAAARVTPDDQRDPRRSSRTQKLGAAQQC